MYLKFWSQTLYKTSAFPNNYHSLVLKQSHIEKAPVKTVHTRYCFCAAIFG